MKELKKDLKETFAYMANSFMMCFWGLVTLTFGIVSLTGNLIESFANAMLEYPGKRMDEYKKLIS